MRPWDLTLETDAESAARPSSPDPNLSERQGPQPREEQEGLHVEPLEAGGVLSGGTRLELVDPYHTPAEIDIQTLAGEREPGEPGEASNMRPKDRPGGRTGPMNEHLEEPIVRGWTSKI